MATRQAIVLVLPPEKGSQEEYILYIYIYAYAQCGAQRKAGQKVGRKQQFPINQTHTHNNMHTQVNKINLGPLS